MLSEYSKSDKNLMNDASSG